MQQPGVRLSICLSVPSCNGRMRAVPRCQLTYEAEHRLVSHIVHSVGKVSVFYRPDALPAAQPTASKH